MRTSIFSAFVVLGLASCATPNPGGAGTSGISPYAPILEERRRLALYMDHSGAPVRRINYTTPVGWSRIDGWHFSLDLRPGERWLVTLSGPCLNWDHGAQTLDLEPLNGIMLSRFDKVKVGGENFVCRIQDIRPVDLEALRAAERALRGRL